ncbi:MAG: hypothetical protein KIS87_08860 [Phycisphaeraceae bacterium]|nr:hypothetical protein [Phycisphaeraceae bacterium]
MLIAYDLRCGCGWRGSVLLPPAERYAFGCPRCGAAGLETDWSDGRAPSVQRQWQGHESVSPALGVLPEQVPEAARDCPSWEFDARGDAVFHSDAHMRRCLRELADRERRDAEREAERQDRELRDAADGAPPFATDLPPLCERPTPPRREESAVPVRSVSPETADVPPVLGPALAGLEVPASR